MAQYTYTNLPASFGTLSDNVGGLYGASASDPFYSLTGTQDAATAYAIGSLPWYQQFGLGFMSQISDDAESLLNLTGITARRPDSIFVQGELLDRTFGPGSPGAAIGNILSGLGPYLPLILIALVAIFFLRK